jgi:hypothetical protein
MHSGEPKNHEICAKHLKLVFVARYHFTAQSKQYL